MKVSYRKEKEQIVLSLPHEIMPGAYLLRLDCAGALTDGLRGFYRSSFVDEKGKKQYLYATQMEPTDARRMFACFDEPQYKATFSVKLSIQKNLAAISNCPIAKEMNDTDWPNHKFVVFETTPKMSTYLLALIVGPLVSTEPKVVDGVPIRVWCRAGQEKLATFSQDLACKLLPFFNNYFGVKYPAPKLDLIAIPDFAAGAMENLGAITFRDRNLLVDEKAGSVDTKQNVAGTVAHEMAHMWFGDLVTMHWWDDLWLNEAFATWMSYKSMEAIMPQWHEWDDFGKSRQYSMRSDALRSTRSIHFSVTDPKMVEQMFDTITYDKGSAVLRMLEQYVGENVFKDGIQRYMRAHQFDNATTKDLWTAIGDASGKDINEMMHGWVYQPGFPVVNVALEKDYSSAPEHKLLLSQERFYLQKPTGRLVSASLWQIPLFLRELSTGNGAVVGDKKIEHQLLSSANGDYKESEKAPLLVNAGSDGYYRVHYPIGRLREIGSSLNQLTVLERGALLSDQYALSIAGDIPIQEYMALTAKYKDEQDSNVISMLLDQFETLNFLVDDQSRGAFSAFVCDRLANCKARLGWTASSGESDLTKLTRSGVLAILGTIGQDKKTISQARDLFKKFEMDKNAMDADLLEPVLQIVAYNGNALDYDRVLHLWRTAATPEIEHTALGALGMFREPELIKKNLAMALTDQVRTQDAPSLIGSVENSVAGRELGWTFVSAHWKQISTRFTAHLLPRIIGSLNALVTPEDSDRVKTFFASNPVPEQSREVAKLIERVEINADFRQRSGRALSSWLASNVDGASEKVKSSMR